MNKIDKNAPYIDKAPEFIDEILWHRIIIVGVVALLTPVAIIWGAKTWIESGPSQQASQAMNINQLEAPKALPRSADLDQTTHTTVDDSTQDTVHPTEAMPSNTLNTSVKTEQEPDVPETINTTAVTQPQPTTPLIEQSKKLVSEQNTAALASPSRTERTLSAKAPSDQSSYKVNVSILNNDVSDAALTDSMNGLEPAHELDSTTALNGFVKLYFYTDVKNRVGDTLVYRWMREGKTVATVKIPIIGKRWRSHSSKNISANARGNWQVVVEDSSGQKLAQSSFILKP